MSIFDNPEKWMAQARFKIQGTVVNATFDEMSRKHPKKFPEAYKWLTSLDPMNEKARKTVQRIWESENPGAALMSWYAVKCATLRSRKDWQLALTKKKK